MNLGSPTLWLGIAWIVAAIALLALGSEARRRQRRGFSIGLTTAGVLVTLAPVAALAWGVVYRGAQPSVSVDALDPASDPRFTVEIPNRTSFDSGDRVDFNPRGDLQDVINTFEAQYPDGVSMFESNPSGTGDGSAWYVSRDDVRFDLWLRVDNETYSLITQVVVVQPSDEAGPRVRIPFPVSALDVTGVTEGQSIANSWPEDEWRAFYSGMSAVTFGDETITVPTNRGGTATLTFDRASETYTIDIND